MVLHAVNSHDNDAFHIILEAGVDSNPKVPKDLFCSNPLIAVSFDGLMGMIKLLIKFGTKINECNSEGQTALQAVASMQNIKCVNILLTCDVNLNYILKNGHSPFITVIMYNNHTVLKLFLNQYHISCQKWPQLLPIIAKSVDTEMILILTSSDLLLKWTLLNRDGFAVGCGTLQLQMNYDEKLNDVFEELYFIAMADKEAAASRHQTVALNLS